MSENMVEKPGCSVPEWMVNDPSISDYALVCILYLSKLPIGSKIDIDLIKARFGFGDRLWTRISRELKRLDIIKLVRFQGGCRLDYLGYPEHKEEL